MLRGWTFARKRPAAPADPRERSFVVGLGAMKSGTTWLSNYLLRHPDFLQSPVKEMNFFNQLADSPFRHRDDGFRLAMMEQVILADTWRHNPLHADRLRGLAQIGAIATPEAYLAFFAERLRLQTHFGEISPSYALLDVATLRLMAGLSRDTRFLFVMRDPARRAASHLRHLRRRERMGATLEELLAEIGPGNPAWMLSDYGRTMDLLDAAGVMSRCRLLVFETLFTDTTIRSLCDWLGLRFVAPRADRPINKARGDDFSAAQLAELRFRLDPIYADLRTRSLPDGAEKWWWG